MHVLKYGAQQLPAPESSKHGLVEVAFTGVPSPSNLGEERKLFDAALGKCHDQG